MSNGLYILSQVAYGKYKNLTTKQQLSLATIQSWIEQKDVGGTLLTLYKERVDVPDFESQNQNFAWAIRAEISDQEHKILMAKTWRSYGLSVDLENRFANNRSCSIKIIDSQLQ